MKSKSLLFITAFLIITNSLTAQVTDKDGKNYKTVKIGEQVWMAENLDVNHFNNGDIIPEVEDPKAWVQASKDGKPAWCYYNSDPANEKIYGKLYNWYAVHDPRGLAVDGWHIPVDAEWTDLTTYLGGKTVAGMKMKATSGWNSNGNGTNKSGFSGLPGGSRTDDGTFEDIGKRGSWWSSTKDESDDSFGDDAWYRYLSSGDGSIYRYSDGFMGYGFSVRYIKD